MRSLNILERLNLLFEAEAKNAIVVDLTDHDDAKKALDNCRGPCVGWSDYIAGEDYQPPYTAKGDTPYGPRDGTAFDRSHAPVPENQYSKKYGGVRPWDPDEVILVLLDKDHPSGRYFPRGLWSMIQKYRHVALAASQTWDEEDIMGEVLDSAWQAIIKDEGRIGTEFTKYLATNIDFVGGPSAGVYNEYRDARGILTSIESAIERARKVLVSNKNPDLDVSALVAAIDREMTYKYKRQGTSITAHVDPSIPREKNRLGKFAKPLMDIRNTVVAAIQNKNVEDIDAVLQSIGELRVQIQSEEEIFAGEGISRGRIGSQPRDMPAIGSSAHRWGVADKSGRHTMNRTWDVSINGENVGTVDSENETRAKHDAKLKWSDKIEAFKIAQKDVPEAERKQPKIEVVPQGDDSGAGASSVSSYMVQSKKTGDTIERSDIRHDDKRISIYDDPEAMNVIKRVLVAMRTGGLDTPQGKARRTIDAIDELLRAAQKPIQSSRRYVVQPDNRAVRRPDGETVRAGGFEVMDTIGQEVIFRTDDEDEADDLIVGLNNPVVGTLKKLYKFVS